MGTNSQQKPEAPTFRNNHGLNAPTGCFQGRSLDAVSLAQSSHESGLSRLHDRSRAPHQRAPADATGHRRCVLKYAGYVTFFRTWARISCRCCWCIGVRARGLACLGASTIRALNRRYTGQDASCADEFDAERQGQTVVQPTFQTTAGQRLLRGLARSLRRIRHGSALYRAHPPLSAHGHRPRQPLCLGDRGATP